jgi:hypothetical protein
VLFIRIMMRGVSERVVGDGWICWVTVWEEIGKSKWVCAGIFRREMYKSHCEI